MLVAIPAGGAIAGVLGMFFVVPFVGVIAVLWRPVVAVMRAQALPPSEAPAPPGIQPAEPAERAGTPTP